PNGAGKTTLVKLLLGIARPTRGEAELFGVPIGQPEARRRVGYLPENHRFPDYLTAAQALSLYARLANVEPADRTRRAQELLDVVGLADWADARIRTFSKGMMQRLGIAQALMNSPELVFLDEPTDGVDPIGRREIRDVLLWMREQGQTVFLNSHLLSEIEQVCDRVAIFNLGETVRTGTIEELTQADATWTITSTSIPDALLAELGDLIVPAESTNGLTRHRIRTAGRTELNQVLDLLRTGGVELHALEPARSTLEDSFVRVIQGA
ncbi:MAG: ABC transporter ATP-binding protein, partial [Bacteroidota bacterium]